MMRMRMRIGFGAALTALAASAVGGQALRQSAPVAAPQQQTSAATSARPTPFPATQALFDGYVRDGKMPGIVGGFMRYLPITLLATLSASLVMALIFIPALGARWGRRDSHSEEEQRNIAAAETGSLSDIRGATGKYLQALTWAVDHPTRTFWFAIAILLGIFFSYSFLGAGVEYFPASEPNNIMVNVHARGDLSIYQKDALIRETEKRLLPMTEFKSVYARTGGGGGYEAAADNIGVIQLELKDWQQRRPASQIIEEVRRRTQDMPGVVIEVVQEQSGPSQGKPAAASAV